MATSPAASLMDTIPGLERLQHLAMVHVHQKTTRFSRNKYVVNTAQGQLLFNMKEHGDQWGFLVRGHNRGFHMDAVDSRGHKAFSIRRPGVIVSDKVELFINEKLVNVVRKELTLMKPVFNINDAQDIPVLRIKGEITDYEFKLQTQNKRNIGSISKKFRGVVKEMFTYADDYVINFPVDLDVHYKAAVISACILIDFRYHES